MRPILQYEHICRDVFDELPVAAWSIDVFRAGEFVNRMVDAASVSVLEVLGINREQANAVLSNKRGDQRDLDGETVRTLAREAGVAKERVPALAWLLSWLGDDCRPLVELDMGRGEDGTVRTTPDLGDMATLAVAEFPALAPSAELISLVASRYPDFLRDPGVADNTNVEGLAVVPEKLPLQERYFSNRHLVTSTLNALGAHAVEHALALRRGGPGTVEAVDVLEIGGRTGSAAATLLETLGQRIARYHFTDPRPELVRRGRDVLAGAYPELALEAFTVDLDREFPSRLAASHHDLLYGVNAFHGAADLDVTLRYARNVLPVGGVAVMVETVRPQVDRPVAEEFMLQLRPRPRSPARRAETAGEDHRQARFLTGDEWRQAVKRAGFRDVQCIPEWRTATAAYPNLSRLAIIAWPERSSRS